MNRGETRTCGCRCHEDPQSDRPSDLMDFFQAFQRIFLFCVPHSIEADWDPVRAPRLAGLPVNVCYASPRRKLGPEYATYYFDLQHVRGELRRAKDAVLPAGGKSVLWVEVVIRKRDERIETRKYRGENWSARRPVRISRRP